MWQTRKRYISIRNKKRLFIKLHNFKILNIIKIQKVFRGYIGRKIAKHIRILKLKLLFDIIQNEAVTKIQS